MRTLTIGDAVTTPSGQAGILRWRGRINGKPIEYAGVEISNGEGLHSGEHEGHKYFDTKVPGSGIFVSYSKLLSANITTPLSRLGNSRLPALASPGKTSRAQSPVSPQRRNLSGEVNELTRLKVLLEDKEAKIKDLKASKELQRTEFRKHIQSIEADRNQIAEHYENMLRDAANTSTAHDQAEIDVQRTALAAMQNKLMEENEQMRQSLEVAQREAAEAKAKLGATRNFDAPSDMDLDSLLAELNVQEERLAELQDSVQGVDRLRQQNEQLQARNSELEQRCSEMETHLDEVAALQDSLDELTLGGLPGSGGGGSDPAQSQALEEAQKEIERLTHELETQKKRASKFAQEAEDARKDAQMYFKMSMEAGDGDNSDKVNELQDEIAKLKRDLKRSEAVAKNTKLELERVKVSAGSTPKRKSIREHVSASMANGQTPPEQTSSEQTQPKASTAEPILEHVKGPEPKDAAMVSERELEDQILREAGLLDTPNEVPSMPAPVPAAEKADPTAGRSMWCGLCERGGHTSVDCPYD